MSENTSAETQLSGQKTRT